MEVGKRKKSPLVLHSLTLQQSSRYKTHLLTAGLCGVWQKSMDQRLCGISQQYFECIFNVHHKSMCRLLEASVVKGPDALTEAIPLAVPQT